MSEIANTQGMRNPISTSAEISYCPTCGESVAGLDDYGPVLLGTPEEKEAILVYCQNCGTSGPSGITQEEAIAFWNEGNIRRFCWILNGAPARPSVWAGSFKPIKDTIGYVDRNKKV